MAKRAVPEPPLKIPMMDRNGLLSSTWVKWFRELYLRIGGTIAFSNIQLEEEIVGDLDSRLTDVENDVAVHESDISSLSSAITTLQGQVDGLLKAPVPE